MFDHRKLGRELGIFDTDPLIGAGLPYWLPAGAIVRHTLEEYVRGLERKAGYQHVYLETMPELQRAMPVYEKFGFRYLDGPMGNTGHFGCPIWMLKDL